MSDLAHTAHTAAQSNDQPESEYVYILISSPGFYPYDKVESLKDYIEGCASTLELAKSILEDKDSEDELGWQLISNQWQFQFKNQDPKADLDLDPVQIAQNASEYTGGSCYIEKTYVHQRAM
jgi:hypothetical protein